MNKSIKPFWFWNGEMDNDKIVKQIREMSDKGLGGFFIHPRQGLCLPYLSQEWFNRVETAVDTARKYGLEVWLYDEYPYPSGISGGEVLNGHPEYEARILETISFDASGGMEVQRDLPWGEVTKAAAYEIIGGEVKWKDAVDISKHIGNYKTEKISHQNGLTKYSRKRFMTAGIVNRLYWCVPRGNWRIYIFIQTPLRNFKYFGRYIDPINPYAVKRFIQTTHEKYKSRFSHEFGRTIKGVFSDETSPISSESSLFQWSPLIPDLFLERNGYDIIEWLPSLVEHMGENTDMVRYQFWNTLTESFINSYDKQIHQWCKENNLLYACEKNILRSGQLEHMDIPGVDMCHQRVGDHPQTAVTEHRANGKIASSAAFFYGKRACLAECFHSVGWGMTLQDMKWMLDCILIHGIDTFVPHALFYTTDALTKHDAPPSCFYQMPWWKHTGLLTNYIGMIQENIKQCKREIDVILIDPVTSLWTSMGEKKELGDRIKNDFSRLQNVLLENHIDYYVIDQQMLSCIEIKDGKMLFKENTFRILVVPPSLNIENKCMQVVESFIGSGGTVIFTGCIPNEKIEGNDEAAIFIGRYMGISANEIYKSYIRNENGSCSVDTAERKNVTFVKRVEMAADIIRKYSPDSVSIVSEGKEASDIYSACYEKQGKRICFMVNLSCRHIDAYVNLKYGKSGNCTVIKKGLEPGEADTVVESRLDGRQVGISLDFMPYQ